MTGTSRRTLPEKVSDWVAKRVTAWLGLFIFTLILTFGAVLWFWGAPPVHDSFLFKLTDGFTGNLIGGIWGSVLFLFLALHLESSAEGKLDRVKEILERDHEVREVRDRIAQFENFMESEPYYDMLFPEIRAPLHPVGMIYKIEPMRDDQGRPIQRLWDLDKAYVVRVLGPSHEEVMSPDKQIDFDESPLKEGEFYFARMINGHWHLSHRSFPGEAHRFEFFGRMGRVEHGESANNIMEATKLKAGWVEVGKFLVSEDGSLHTGNGGAYQWTLLKDEKGHPWVRSFDSPPKEVYFTKAQGDFTSEDYLLVVHPIRGHFKGEALDRFRASVLKKCQEAGIEPPRVPFYET